MQSSQTSEHRINFDLKKTMFQAFALLLVSVIAASLSWWLRPDALPLQADATAYELELSAPLVDLEEARSLFDEGNYLFIDTRANAAEMETTISSAFLLREKSFDDDLLALMDYLYPEDPILLFGDGDLYPVSNIADKLLKRGYENILILRAGVSGWEKAGGPLSPPFELEPIVEDFPASEETP
ncbi:MAG: rhodanese-like domain-containing protein [bacterium]|nr:rhodanese-like domain-containing protein [bacterium]